MDLDLKDKHVTNNRHSMAFQNSARLSKIGPSLGGLRGSHDPAGAGKSADA